MKEKKIALITGGSSGLGFAFAKQLANEGYQIILVARDKEKLQQAKDALKNSSDTFIFAVDISQEQQVEELYNNVKKDFGKIDFLILNAGITHVKLFLDRSIAEMKEEMDINLWGTMMTARFLIPLMKGGSKILIVSSALGIIGAAGYSVYCATKAALISFAEVLRREFLPKNISVHVSCPADIDTPMYEREKEEMPEWMKNNNRSQIISPEKAAKIMLKKCQGRKFLILTNDVLSLSAATVLPRSIRDFIVDRVLPRPKQ